MRRRENLLITGAAGAGKTTLLAALLAAAPPGERIVTIEDVAELRIDHPHHVRLEARQANLEGAGAIGLARLVREALRMRPDRLVVGECRGEEVRELLTALNTGHDGGAGTVHANSLDDVPARLEALGALAGLGDQALARQVVSAIGLVLHVARGADGIRRLAGVGRPVLDASGDSRSRSRRGADAREPPSGRDPDETVLRLAVLLQAGIAPARAWSHLAEAGDADAARVTAAVGRGIPLSDAIARRGRPARSPAPRQAAPHRARTRGRTSRRRGAWRRSSAHRSPRACAGWPPRCATRRRLPTMCGSRSPSPPAPPG